MIKPPSKIFKCQSWNYHKHVIKLLKHCILCYYLKLSTGPDQRWPAQTDQEKEQRETRCVVVHALWNKETN